MGITLTCLACGQGNRVPKGKLASGPKCGTCGAPLVRGEPVDITLDTLEKARKRDDLPLIVDLWASWCGPCRMMAPQFAAAAKQLQGRARFAKLDTEAFPQAGTRYAVRGIPLLIAFSKGHEKSRRTGVLPAQDIVSWVTGEVGA